MSDALKLTARLDSTAAQALAETLKQMRGQTVQVDAAEVGFAGALGIQVLISACRQWRTEAVEFALTNCSEALQNSCRTLGVSMADIGVPPLTEDSI